MDRYELLTRALAELSRSGALTVRPVGKSVERREIWAVKLGRGKRRILMTGAVHGREWIASDLLLQLSRVLAPEFPYRNLSLTIVPMVNPDGVVAAERQQDLPHKERQKSNTRGVDLNRNFDSRWGTEGVDPEPDFTDGNYPGSEPFSEPETQALRDLVGRENPEVLIDWHFRGGLLDTEHGGPFAEELARLMAEHNGYEIVSRMHYPASGTLGDWFRNSHAERSALAVEIRHGEVHRDWPENRPAIEAALQFLNDDTERRVAPERAPEALAD